MSQALVAFLSTDGNPLFVDLATDWRLLAFTAALAAVACLLFGLAPALQATRAAPGNIIKAGGRGLTASRQRFGLRRALVVSQVALSSVLLVSALLFVRSLVNLLTLDPGFRQDGVMITRADLTALDLPKNRRRTFRQELIDRLRGIPGVQAAAGAWMVPIGGATTSRGVLEGDAQKGNTLLNGITPGYFAVLGMPLLAGRDFSTGDTVSSPRVAIVNQLFAERFLGRGDPIGATFRLEPRPGEAPPVFEIVGLVGNAKWRDLRDEFEPMAFLPALQDQDPGPSITMLLRSSLPPESLLPAVRGMTAEVNSAISIRSIGFRTLIRESLLPQRLMATLSGFFGLLAVLLASIGLYGVMSYLVARRRSEIGIRMALGAGRGTVVRMILHEVALLAGAGLAGGMVLAVAAGRAAQGLLFGLASHDPATLLAAAAGLAAVALLAGYLPARRAANLDPVTALREE